LRARLRFLLTWAESQPEKGISDAGGPELDENRWVRRYPTIPRNHHLHGYVEALRRKIEKALTLVDQQALKDATRLYDEVQSVIEGLSTRLAEPDAARTRKAKTGFSRANEERLAPFRPFRVQVIARLQSLLKGRRRFVSDMAGQIHRDLKPDKTGFKPSHRSVRRWITEYLKQST
jgi:hypothetical protein